MILPLFAFANAGVSLGGVTLDGLTSVLPLGIIAGLFIGKPLGISLFCWLATKLAGIIAARHHVYADHGRRRAVRDRLYDVDLYLNAGVWCACT